MTDFSPAWITDHDNLVGLAGVLVDAGTLDTARDVVYFFEKPWKYHNEWRLWEACDKPRKDDINWTWFTARLESEG